MDPDPDCGLRDSRSGIHSPHPPSRHLSRLDNHGSPNPPVSYSTANHNAVSANTNAQVLAHHAAATLEPDDFYKSYGSFSPNSEPESLPMTSPGPLPSLRLSGDRAATRHLPLPINRPGLQSLRSVSSPLDSRSTVTFLRSSQAGQPSVKDLKKRFDQNNSANSIPRLALRQDAPATRPGQDSSKTKPQDASTAYTNPRSTTASPGSSRETQPTTPLGRQPRSKYAALEQASGNSQSFASRLGKPPSSANRNSIDSKSMTQLPHKSPPLLSQPHLSSPKHNFQSPGLLFGEVLPEQCDISTPGFGIDNIHLRRTSESSAHELVGRQRSFSDLGAEPSSPTSWYRSIHANQEAAFRAHGRSQSDVSALKPATAIVRKVSSETPTLSASKPPATASRLPVSIRRLNSPTNSSSSSTRSNSPSAFRRVQTNGKYLKNNPPTPHAKTSMQSSRKPPPPGLVTPINNTRLQAYIAERPSKLSPPLRSSRPRQPVSEASTASSRMKGMAKVKSPTRLNERNPLYKASKTGRRKISVGPIDFAQRREHIRLAYTKSIRESQAFEARQNATDNRRKDMETAATVRPLLSATETATTSIPSATVENDTRNKRSRENEAGAHLQTELSQSPAPASIIEPAVEPFAESVSDTAKSAVPAPEISTDLAPSADDGDSPTLGLAGNFPSSTPPNNTVERSPSAASTTSATTEFDVELQTEPLVPDQLPSSIPIAFSQSLRSQIPVPTRFRIEFQYPFEDETLSPRQLSATDETVQNHYPFEDEALSPMQLPANNITVQNASKPVTPKDYGEEQVISGDSYDGDDECPGFVPHKHRTYQTAVTILPQPQDEPRASENAGAISYSNLDIHDEPDCLSELETMQVMTHNVRNTIDDTTTGSCIEETVDRNDLEEPRPTYRNGDYLSSHRASTCASSEVETFDDLLYPYDQQSTAGSSNRLTVPTSRSKAGRLSNQSVWTDFSIDSEVPNSPTMQNGQSSPYGQGTNFDLEGFLGNNDALMNVPPKGLEILPSDGSTLSSVRFSQQHLPKLNADDGFSVPYLTPEPSTSLSYLPSPNHEPPPVPASGSNSVMGSRASSVFYEQSQYDSTPINSERGSEEFMSHLETPQSMDLTLSEATNRYFGAQTPADSDTKSFVHDSGELSSKERHRLVQRRNVIKELVDTEAVFVRDMNIVEEIYKGTAEACPELDSKTVKLIFRNSDEIIDFHTSFLIQLKEAVAGIYVPKAGRTHLSRDESLYSEPSQTSTIDLSDLMDRTTAIGPVFKSNMEKMKLAHEGFLRNSDQAAKRLIQIQQDSTVKVWLNECNEVAKDLTAAWDLDSLLIKPMQRITKYPNLIMTLLQHTPKDHPDREALVTAKNALEEAIIEINKTKKNFELVGQIVGRKRKESDVKAGIARAFGKRVDKLQAGNRPPEDPDYAKLEERFSDDYLRLQVVLRDVEFYTRQVSSYVHEFLQYLSAIELIMRLQRGNYPELESKWVQFNISVRDIEKVALEQHLSQVQKHVIEPFEHVIKAYGNPSLAMKKRQKRRMVWERSEQMKRTGKTVDLKLKELVEQYEALNDTLIKELPKLSALTEKVGHICLGNFVNIQVTWYAIWKERMKTVLNDAPEMPDLEEIVATFQRDFPYANDLLSNIGIVNPACWGRASQSTTTSGDDALLKARSRPSESDTRGRGFSVNGDSAPILPAPDFGKRHSESFILSPSGSASGSGAVTRAGGANVPSPHQYNYRDYYSNLQKYQPSLASPRPSEAVASSRSLVGTGQASTRPSTGRSFDSAALRQSIESVPQLRRDSSAYNSSLQLQESRRYSNLFHSALPPPDGSDENHGLSRGSSREGAHAADGYNILWLAASLFEFNIATTKHEAGYPYLTYQAGEIFDVIAEKGELWLAKNQDDSTDQVGWIWSKHFAKLADS